MVSKRTDRTMRYITRPIVMTFGAAGVGALIGAQHVAAARGAAIAALILWAVVVACLLALILTPKRHGGWR